MGDTARCPALRREQSSGRAQEVNPQDYTRITQVPRAEMDAWLKQEVAASGGNWNKDRYHFYIGFLDRAFRPGSGSCHRDAARGIQPDEQLAGRRRPRHPVRLGDDHLERRPLRHR